MATHRQELPIGTSSRAMSCYAPGATLLDFGMATLRSTISSATLLSATSDVPAPADLAGSQVVERHFFGGVDLEETAEVLKISTHGQRDWTLARTWLFRQLSEIG